VFGSYRYTNDIDILVDIEPNVLEEFVRELTSEFTAEAAEMREAFRRDRPYNVIHKATAYKFDLFPAGAQPFERSELGRRKHTESNVWGFPFEFAVVSPEDVLLAKLRWYRAGGGASEQQWRDVTGIVDVQGPRLDLAYLEHWARALGVEDLLNRLLR
jgi:hypothetical protein